MAAVDPVHQHRFSTHAPLGLSHVPTLASQPRQLMANDAHGRPLFRHKPQLTQTNRPIALRPLPGNRAPHHSVCTQFQLADFGSMKS
jgi:hypothetical protein